MKALLEKIKNFIKKHIVDNDPNDQLCSCTKCGKECNCIDCECEDCECTDCSCK